MTSDKHQEKKVSRGLPSYTDARDANDGHIVQVEGKNPLDSYRVCGGGW